MTNSEARKRIAELQAEAEPSGYHRELRAWVDNNSSAARVLNATDEDTLRDRLTEFVNHLATTQSVRIAVEQERANIVRRLRAILRDD